ncbi:MAG: hypothetical protein ACLRQR_13525 [Merdimonas faecis]|uniref:hypothetical protein n=1 Tax=Merdimonas faecis TaxID=1653435 RepID=UPI00399086DA
MIDFSPLWVTMKEHHAVPADQKRIDNKTLDGLRKNKISLCHTESLCRILAARPTMSSVLWMSQLKRIPNP